MKNVKVKIKNEDGAGGMEAGETPMFAGWKAGSAVSPGSVGIAVSGVGSVPGAEGEKEENGEKARKNAHLRCEFRISGFWFLKKPGRIQQANAEFLKLNVPPTPKLWRTSE